MLITFKFSDIRLQSGQDLKDLWFPQKVINSKRQDMINKLDELTTIFAIEKSAADAAKAEENSKRDESDKGDNAGEDQSQSESRAETPDLENIQIGKINFLNE